MVNKIFNYSSCVAPLLAEYGRLADEYDAILNGHSTQVCTSYNPLYRTAPIITVCIAEDFGGSIKYACCTSTNPVVSTIFCLCTF